MKDCIRCYSTVVIVKVMRKFVKLCILCLFIASDYYIMLWASNPGIVEVGKNLGIRLSAQGHLRILPNAFEGK